MAYHRLDNYLRTFRRRAGLSQAEVAFLLGRAEGSLASRYEHGRRTPHLETALAYQAILHIPIDELFAGMAERAERSICERARRLIRRLEREAAYPSTAQKLVILQRIIADYQNRGRDSL